MRNFPILRLGLMAALIALPGAALAASGDAPAVPETSGTSAAAPAAAKSDSDFEKRRTVAAEYVALYLQTADLEGVALKIMQPMLAHVAQTQPDLWKEKKARLTGIAVGMFARALHDALSSLDMDMARNFTLAELTALRDFYTSPEGRSVMMKMPGFMEKAMPAAVDHAMRSLGGISRALEAEGVKPGK